MKYFLKRDHGSYLYYETEDYDPKWLNDLENNIEVPRHTGIYDLWDFDLEQWVFSEENYMSHLRSRRNKELLRTDKFMIVDYPISEENRDIAMIYRMELRDAPNHEDIADRVMPECPEILM